jgi:hypothetical protein
MVAANPVGVVARGLVELVDVYHQILRPISFAIVIQQYYVKTGIYHTDCQLLLVLIERVLWRSRYPTLAALAGTPPPQDSLDGVSIVPFITQPQLLSFPTSTGQGTLNKTVAFSQYPHNIKTSGVAICPFFCHGSCRPDPGCGLDGPSEGVAAGAADLSVTEWMGFSVRDALHRYTVWIPYNGTRAQWPSAHPQKGYTDLVYEELYDEGSNMSNFDSFDTANMAYRPERLHDSARYFGLVREFFHEIQPAVPAPPPPPPKPSSCEGWCKHEKHPWSAQCKWPGCSACPQCHEIA